MVAPPAPRNAINISITGDLTGFVSGDPPLDATGDLDAIADFPSPNWTLVATTWAISDPPDFGAATVGFIDGAWTYSVDPAFYDTLDPGEIAFDSFEITATVLARNPGGQLRSSQESQTISIEIEGICFTAGTLIGTPEGEKCIDALRQGDLVKTRDRGAAPIRWIESAEVDRGTLAATPKLRPVRISAGALGHGLPRRDLLVSQDHRVLVSGEKVTLLFGENEVLVAAKFLLAWPGIDLVLPEEPVRYVHILLDHHALIDAEGTPAETLYLGTDALSRLGSEALEEIAAIFPNRPELGTFQIGAAARRILKKHEAQVLTSARLATESG
jgi:VCBS repeat-containing protein